MQNSLQTGSPTVWSGPSCDKPILFGHAVKRVKPGLFLVEFRRQSLAEPFLPIVYSLSDFKVDPRRDRRRESLVNRGIFELT
jgi:hypothetical protein